MLPVSDAPLIATVLPPGEGFGPGRTGAVGLIVRRLARMVPALVLGGEQAGPVFDEVPFRAVRPPRFLPGNVNTRYAAGIARALRQIGPALIEVHNRTEVALSLARRFPRTPVVLFLHNDPQSMRHAGRPEQRARLLSRLARVVTVSEFLRRRLLDGVQAPAGRSPVVLPNPHRPARRCRHPGGGSRLSCLPGGWCRKRAPMHSLRACAERSAAASWLAGRGDRRRPVPRRQPRNALCAAAACRSGAGRGAHARLSRSSGGAGGTVARRDRRGAEPMGGAVRAGGVGSDGVRGCPALFGPRRPFGGGAGRGRVRRTRTMCPACRRRSLPWPAIRSVWQTWRSAGRNRARSFGLEAAAMRLSALAPADTRGVRRRWWSGVPAGPIYRASGLTGAATMADATMPPANEPVPVTVLTGYLGAGKTTLLNRILTEQHGRKYAVVINEFGELGVDNDLVVDSDEEVFEMNNGCICCTVRGDLIRIVGGLMKRRDKFDGIIIETTGPGEPRARWRRRSSSMRACGQDAAGCDRHGGGRQARAGAAGGQPRGGGSDRFRRRDRAEQDRPGVRGGTGGGRGSHPPDQPVRGRSIGPSAPHCRSIRC